jgi:hypothetical protein
MAVTIAYVSTPASHAALQMQQAVRSRHHGTLASACFGQPDSYSLGGGGGVRYRFERDNIDNSAYRFTPLEIEPDVENADAMGEPADRDQIDAGSGDLRSFGDRPAGDQRDGFREHS